MPSRDENFNPVFIVVEYETFDTGHAAYTYGGRAAVKMLDNRVQVGVTHVHEGTPGAEGDLTGVDASVHVDAEDEGPGRGGVDQDRPGRARARRARPTWPRCSTGRESLDGKRLCARAGAGLRPGPAERQRNGDPEVRDHM